MALIHNEATDGEFFRRQIELTLTAQIRAQLKEPLMKQAEEMVDQAVASAVAMLRPRVQTQLDEMGRRFDVRVLFDPIIKPETQEAGK